MNLINLSRFLAICCSCWATPLFASQLWGVTVGNSTSINLHPIESATGVVLATKSIGANLTFANVDDLASDPARQPSVVWAIRSSIAGNELIAVNPFQGQLLSLTVLNAPTPILSIAIDPTDGAFYGASSNFLYRIAPETGAATLVGATAMPVHKALGFDLQGNLFGVSHENILVNVNKATAATAAVATFSLYRMEDIAVRPEDGVMFGLGYAPYSLYQMDKGTAQVVEVGPSLGRPGGLAFTAVPEPAAAALCLLAVLGILAARRAT
jgi:hypothetical protein